MYGVSYSKTLKEKEMMMMMMNKMMMMTTKKRLDVERCFQHR